MELNEEFIKANDLSVEQVTAINTNISTQETSWQGKSNENAEGILTGASVYAQKQAGIELPRNDGEKFGDYLNRLGDASISGKTTAIEKLEGEWTEKLKGFKGNEALQQEHDKLKDSMDVFKQKAAQFDEVTEKDILNKFKSNSEELSNLKRNLAFNSEKPNFPDTANKFEVKAKWDEFISGVEAKYDIHLDKNNNPILKDKENEFSITTLKDLVTKDKNITDLLKGTKVPGLNTKPGELKLEGVPFKVSEKMTSIDRSNKIKEYLMKEKGLSITSSEYAKQFSALNSAILTGKTSTN
tara:strand:+ start:8552 stop:9445 length:894 start_codon:yes stop_codon:yes gene_type:complete